MAPVPPQSRPVHHYVLGGCGVAVLLAGLFFGFLMLFPLVGLSVLHQEVKKVEVQQANQRRQQEARHAEARRALQVVSTGVEKDNWGTYAVGKVVNRGGDTYRDLTVAIHVLDGAGNVIGSTSARFEHLAPGETWAFRTHADKNAAGARVTDVSAR